MLCAYRKAYFFGSSTSPATIRRWSGSTAGSVRQPESCSLLRCRHRWPVAGPCWWTCSGTGTATSLLSYTLVDHAQTVVELIDRLGVEECVLVGHSMGGEIAIRVAAARPGVVKTLVMAEGTVDPHGEEVFGGQTEDEFVSRGFAELVASQRSSAEADPGGIPAIHLGLTQLLEPRAVYRSDVSMRDGHGPSARSLLAGLEADLWYLVGELSEPEPEFEAGMRALGVSYLRVPDTGHAMGLQNPRGLAAAVAAIITGTASAVPAPTY